MSQRSMRRARIRELEKAERRRSRSKRGIALGAGAAVGAASVFVPAVPVAADTTFTVTSLADPGDGTCDADCTLREAVDAANATAGADVVTFASSVTGTITLTAGDIYIYDDVEIKGPGADALTIDGAGNSRIFYAEGSDGAEIAVTISGLTLTGGDAGDGGAIYSDETKLTIADSVLTGNTASRGGAVYTSDGSFVMTNTTVSDNTASDYGGGLHIEDNDAGEVIIRDSTITGNSGSNGGGVMLYDLNRGSGNSLQENGATIQRTTISANTALYGGGGIYLEDSYFNGGAVLIEDSTISGNAAEDGGGIFKGNGESNDTDKLLTIRNTTISGNSATDVGGGIYIDDDDDQDTTLAHSTVVDNTAATAGGGIYRLGNDDDPNSVEQFIISNSIVANNESPASDLSDPDPPAEGSFVLSYSLIEDPGTATTTENPAGSNVIGVDPQLGPLQDNGGPTRTHVPAASSPAVEAGDPNFAPPPATEQRGFSREVGRLDMGSVEIQAVITVADVSVGEGDSGTTPATVTLTLSQPSSSPVTVVASTADGSAAAGVDYTASSQTVTFAPGETTKTFTFLVHGDTIQEATETVLVNLSNSNGPVIADGQAVVSILDDDPDAVRTGETGYRMVASDGGVFVFGDRGFHGSLGDRVLNKPIVGGATNMRGFEGYYLVGADGGVFTFGDAPFFGSMAEPGSVLDSVAVDIEETQTGMGYWIVSANGFVYPFGDAQHFGDARTIRLNQQIIAMTPTPTGKGYWLVGADGGIFSFGDAEFFGSMGAVRLNAPVIDLAATPDGNGYYLAAKDGGIFTFGNAEFHGSTANLRLNQPVIAMLVAPTGVGYWLAAGDGGIFTFGPLPFWGSMGGIRLNGPVLDLIS